MEPRDELTPPATHAPLLSLPPTTSLATLQGDHQDAQDTPDAQDHDLADTQEIDSDSQQSLAPVPLAVKPVYKKRVVVPSTRPDGIIRRSGSQAVIEKQMIVNQRTNRQRKSNTSVYEDMEVGPSTSIPVQSPSVATQEQNTLRSPTKRKATVEPKLRKKQKSSPVVWKPRSMDDEAQPAPKTTFNRESYLGHILRYQATQKDRISQLTTRALPLQDLQTLVGAEIDHEESALTELGTTIYKEYLKLQLEEGVLMNLLYLTKAGVLDAADLERVKAPRKYSKRQPKPPNTGKSKTRVSRASSPTPSVSAVPSTVGSPAGTSYLESTGLEMEEGNVDGEGEDDEGDRGDVESDTEGYDASEPVYQAPGESYSMPSIGPSNPFQVEDEVGRPEVSVRNFYGLDGKWRIDDLSSCITTVYKRLTIFTFQMA
ncbi:hypothetical protein B0O80DRAFT_469380 [Mortierella sp. GBAus27b]|nr:hypothetical protein B0O80DRAFT_469380 [Mortierella sp. GBAus27b]